MSDHLRDFIVSSGKQYRRFRKESIAIKCCSCNGFMATTPVLKLFLHVADLARPQAVVVHNMLITQRLGDYSPYPFRGKTRPQTISRESPWPTENNCHGHSHLVR